MKSTPFGADDATRFLDSGQEASGDDVDRQMAPPHAPASRDSANQSRASSSASERCQSSPQAGIENAGFDGEGEPSFDGGVRGVCAGETTIENRRVASDISAKDRVCDHSECAISGISRCSEVRQCHVSRDLSWLRSDESLASVRPNSSFVGSSACFARYGALRIKSRGKGKHENSSVHHRPASQLTRLWFQRLWDEGQTSEEVWKADGLNPYPPHCSGGVQSDDADISVAAFPDVELGHDSTSLPSTPGSHDEEEGCLKNQLSPENVDVGSDTPVCASSQFDAVNRRDSSLCYLNQRVYSIGVFYCDTDQCEVPATDNSPHDQSSVTNSSVFDADEIRISSRIDNGVEGCGLPPNQVQVRCFATPRSRGESGASMARGMSGGDIGQNRQSGNNNSNTGEGPNPAASEHRDRRLGNRGGEGSCRSRHANERRVPNTQLTPETFTQLENNNPVASSSDNILPDILNSHLPPPYSTLPPTGDRGNRRLPPPSHPPPPPPLCGNPGTVLPPCPHSTPRRSARGRGAFRGFPPRDRLRSSGRRATFGAPAASETEEPKHCCGVMVTQTVSIRWFIVMIAFVGLCCAIVGTVLGALKATGREHLTVSLLMIGVGIVLITVSGIAWRLTSHDAPSCRAMLGLHTTEQEPNRRFVPRVPPYGRPHHPYAAMMYPEFQYRPPPPSYQASMQEYRLRLLLLDRQQGASSSSALSPVSPPPTYRSQTNSTLHSRPPLTLTEREYSRPPSYRSRASSAGVLRPSTETLASAVIGPGDPSASSAPAPTASHSRNPSLSLSFLSHESLFVDSSHSRPPDSGTAAASDNTNPVHFTSPSGESQNSVVAGLSDDSPLAAPEHPLDLSSGSWRRDRAPSMWALRKHPDVNAVTIVQTTDSSQVLNQDTVILSISGHHPRTPEQSAATASGEVQILAHV